MNADYMRVNHFEFEADSDTVFLFNGALYLLMTLFVHSEQDSIKAINHYLKL